MPTFEKILQSTSEKLYGDERLRSNLSDEEAKMVLGWADAWIAERVNDAIDEVAAKQIAQSELARVKPVVAAINELGKKPGAPALGEAVAALALKPQPPLTRAQTFRVLGVLTSTVWKTAKK